MTHPFLAPLTLSLVLAGSVSFAQNTQVPFGGLKHDASQKIEISSDSLVVSQGRANAEFKGAVKAGQGTLKIEADRLLVEYVALSDGSLSGGIETMSAFGNVTLTNGAEAAQAQEAIYRVADGQVRMTGDVILTQGRNAIAGNVLNINLDTGDATFEGRVRTVLEPIDN
jgi:lipopolysaccharide export system protein LptA